MPRHKNQVNFDPNSKPSIFDPHTSLSQFQPLHWNKVNSDRSNWNQVYFDHSYNNQVSMLSTLKACHFPPVFFARYNHRSMLLWYSSRNTNYINQLVAFLTCSYYSKTPNILRRYIYHIVYFTTWYLHDYVWYWWSASVTFHPSCTQYFFVSKYITANTANIWRSTALLILIVYHQVQSTEFTSVLTYCQLFWYTTRDDLARPIPEPHITHFVVRSEKMRHSNMADPPFRRRCPF